METTNYINFDKEQLSKIGNALIYLSSNINRLPKTKALKLIYILDELSIKQSGIPFFNLQYKVWKYGPVNEELFVDLTGKPTLFKEYIQTKTDRFNNVTVTAKKDFCDDEFTQNDLDLLNFVVEKFGKKTTTELKKYTHRENSPWYNIAKANNVLELLEKEKINTTEYYIDFLELIAFDERKMKLYNNYLNI